MRLVVAAVTGVVMIVPFRALFPDCGPHRGFLDREPVELRVLANVQDAPLVEELATKAFLATRPEVDGRCIVVHVDEKPSGEAERALARGWDESRDGGPRPDVWIPLTRTWVDLLRKSAGQIVPDKVPSITRTPEVIAMPQPMAEALGWRRGPGWSGTRIGWKDIYDLAQHPDGWKSKGHEQWGRFWLARTNPNTSTSGLYSTVAAYYAGKIHAELPQDTELTSGDLAHPRVVEFVKGVESSVLFYGDTSLRMLSQLAAATRRDEALEFVSAITVAETSVVNYNLGYATGEAGGKKGDVPKVKLVALYPAEGTLFADQVYAILSKPQLTDEKRVAAEKLLGFLLSGTAQKRFQEHGFRTRDGTGGEVLNADPGITADPTRVPELSPPPPNVIEAVQDSWSKLRKRVRVLVVVDLSGSTSRLERVQGALDASLKDHFGPEDEVGLWVLSSGDSTHVEVVPLAPIGEQRNGLLNNGRWPAASPGTRLYGSLQDAIRRFGDADRINGIVVLTDRRHDEPGLNSLLGDLDNARRGLGLRIFPIGWGEKTDCDTLRRIADTARTNAYCLGDNGQARMVGETRSFEEVFTEVIESF